MKVPNFVKSIIVGVPIGITILDTIGYVARVDGISMQPALNPDRDLAFARRMRAISLINHLEFDFNGSVVRKGVTLGDVDNDGNYELVVGNENGDVVIFKALEKWQTITDLGFVSCVIVGDILNRNRNYLVIVTADGWCYIYSAAQSDVLDSFDSKDLQSDKRSDQVCT
ncbi:integrin alpha repeat domain-containing [Holotrichia oblita]|uniref:Integrin alpha repeat domain-containing n=1 Tax=Holotrichia oblita TaxID=644536 RepID=A0ACB9TYN7_HOLOL|nr:integrin alpha repeat domain-containing [Holotrichia oblita]